GSIVAKETGPLNGMPPYVIVPRWERNRQYQDYFKSAFLGPDYDPMTIPDPADANFEVDDLSLPKSLAPAAVENRRSFLDVVDHHHHGRVRPHSLRQSRPGSRSLAHLLVDRAGRRRHSHRPGGRQKR